MRNQNWELAVVAIITFLWAPCLFAQGPGILWTQTYGGMDRDDGSSVIQTADGGYAAVGFTSSSGAGRYDVYLVKTDGDGNLIWAQTYGGASLDWGQTVQQASDGGYIIAGGTYSFGAGAADVYLIRTDADGDPLWARTYGGTAPDVGYSAKQTPDGGYVITGWTYSFGAGDSDVYLIKTDAEGNPLWTRTYGGAEGDVAYALELTSDGGYIIVGQTSSVAPPPGDVYLIKTDAGGDSLWTKTYGCAACKDYGLSVRQTSDGGYIIAGGTCLSDDGGKDVYVVKTDASGDSVWTKTYGGAEGEVGYSVQEISQGEYVIAGWTTSFGAGKSDVYLVRADANGDTVWTQAYGGPGYDWGHSVEVTPEGGYLIGGGTDSYGAGDLDVFVIKTGPSALSRGGVGGSAVPASYRVELGSPFPNPFLSSTRLSFSLPTAAEVEIQVFDAAGREVKTLWQRPAEAGLNFVRWDGCDRDGETAASGVYFLRLKSGSEILTQRVVLVR
jgi:hypothetical protein